MDYILCSVWTRKENQKILCSADLSVSAAVNNGFIQSLVVRNTAHRLGKQQLSPSHN